MKSSRLCMQAKIRFPVDGLTAVVALLHYNQDSSYAIHSISYESPTGHNLS